MSGQGEIRGPKAASVAAPTTPGQEAKGRKIQEEPETLGDRVLKWLAYAIACGMIFLFLLYAWRTASGNWDKFLAVLETLRGCSGLQCSLDAAGNAAQLMDMALLWIGILFWALLHKRHPLLSGVVITILAPVLGQLAIADKWRYWATGLCFAAGAYWGVLPGQGEAGRIYLTGFSLAVMLARRILARRRGA